MEEYLSHSRYRGEGIDPASSNETDFVDNPQEASSALRSGRRWGGEKVGVERKQEGEGNWIGIYNKIIFKTKKEKNI